jgi:hypothetical protein
MSLDASKRLSNLKDSVKKWFVDEFKEAQAIPVLFDRTISTPDIPNSKTINRWVVVNLGGMIPDTMARMTIDVFCCTRSDSEGYMLAQLVDNVVDKLDTADYRITLYRSRETGSWTEIGKLLVTDIEYTGEGVAPDKTKFYLLVLTVRWGTK